MTREKAFALLVNGMIAFGLNIVSFSANKKTGVSLELLGSASCANADSDHTHQALTMTVAANCKQVLTIAIAVFLFNLHINFTNGIGILLTLIGGVSRGVSQARVSPVPLFLTRACLNSGMVWLHRVSRKEQQGPSQPSHKGSLDESSGHKQQLDPFLYNRK